ncbi:MAG: hypothetical protein NT120_01760 [Candidatus Aenigmarchaeota archaeon]|nr:hypothetical protein [Candidatus Aenigmarchaeota archaeon]
MNVLTKNDSVFEASSSCPGCGSILGLKFLLQSYENLENTVLVTSPGSISSMGKAGLHVNFVNSRNPAATARGLAKANPDLNVVVYAGDGFTNTIASSLLAAKENFLYVCHNSSILSRRDFAKILGFRTAYTATASVAYYEDFISKLKKSQQKTGFKFIELFAPCPVTMNYDPSNTVEIGRIATETGLWPLYEIENALTITKIPPRIEPVQRYMETLRITMTEEEQKALQDYVTKNWKSLNEGKIV